MQRAWTRQSISESWEHDSRSMQWRCLENMSRMLTSMRYEEEWPGKGCTSVTVPIAPP